MGGLSKVILVLSLSFKLKLRIQFADFPCLHYSILHLFCSLAPLIFELEKCYLHENWSDFNQKSIGVLRPDLACLDQKLR